MATTDTAVNVVGKRIKTVADLEFFHQSDAYAKIFTFIFELNESIKHKTLSRKNKDELSEVLQKLTDMILRMHSWLDQHPPFEQRGRFGNKAFRDWMDCLEREAESICREFVPEGENQDALVSELATYLRDGFGNKTRIDYGTGHELNFFAFLCCLKELGLIQPADHEQMVFTVFCDYLKLMQRLQKSYWLEPAGSHGVWGLDDYQFLPFIFGAGQLADHPTFKPESIHSTRLVEENADKYIYFDCIRYINSIKKGVFGEHSPMLNDISGVPNWAKVNSGLMKMYHAEVLGKLQIVQHFPFGSLLKFEKSPLARRP